MTTATVVIPCYNEAGRLQTGPVREFVRARRNFKLLFVNDGSTDNTLSLLNEMAESLPGQISVLDLPHNCGKAEAVRRGVLAAIEDAPDYVGFLDADLATPLDELPRLIDVLDRRPGIEIVIGTRIGLLGRRIDRKRGRSLLGRLFALVASRAIGLPIYDTQCGAKMFRVSADTAALFAEPFHSRWIFDVELFARLIMRFRAAASHAISRHPSCAVAPPPRPSPARACGELSRAGEGERPDANALAASVVYELPLEQWQDVAGSKVRSRDFVRAVFELGVIYWRYFVRPASARQPEAAPESSPIAGPLRRPSFEHSSAQGRRAA
ncbi:MAG: glycosyltransferase [Planctomycetaceae bacterium]